MSLDDQNGDRPAVLVPTDVAEGKPSLKEGLPLVRNSRLVLVENQHGSFDDAFVQEVKDGFGGAVEVAVEMQESSAFRVFREEWWNGLGKKPLVQCDSFGGEGESLGPTSEVQMPGFEVEPVLGKTTEGIEPVKVDLGSGGLAEVVEGPAFENAELAIEPLNADVGEGKGDVLLPGGEGSAEVHGQ